MCVNTIVFNRPMRCATRGRHQLRRGTERPGPEAKGAGLRQRQTETLQHPQRQQRVHHQPAGERVDVEKRRQPHDDTTQGPERRESQWRGYGDVRWRLAIEPPHEQANCAVKQEHRAQRSAATRETAL